MDVVILLLVVVFAIRGFVRGAVGQVLGLIGVLAGLWAAGWVSQWVGAHWLGARPAVVYWVLRWLVAALAGLAVASLFGWCGGRLRESLHAGPAKHVDRAGGVAVGVAVAAVWLVAIFTVALLVPAPRRVGDSVAQSRLVPTLMSGAARASGLAEKYLPGGRWLQQRFLAAERRTRTHTHTRSS